MQPRTHLKINSELCGEVVEIQAGRAVVGLRAAEAMRVDDRGLIHGSFVFGLADYAAMLAVNDPNVVLGAADVKFLAPIVVGDEIRATAVVTEEKGKKRVVETEATVGDRAVFQGTFVTFVLDAHVLD